jgi:NAD(P)-dependent dehydrogenase (short-subunit alcohol dehydrogenase family)
MRLPLQLPVSSRSWGHARSWFNNAAARRGEALMNLNLEDWNRVIAVNLTGALICVQAFGGQMIAARRGGSIVNVASITGHHPLPQSGAYSVTKSGIRMLSRLLALELAEHRVRSNVVSPGLVRTSASEIAYRDPEVAGVRQQMIPAGRISDPVDVANVIAFLASDRSSYINGQEIIVDGA